VVVYAYDDEMLLGGFGNEGCDHVDLIGLVLDGGRVLIRLCSLAISVSGSLVVAAFCCLRRSHSGAE
jgi:hypothetical protein